MNPEIEKLTRIISEAQEAIAAIRAACPHEEYKVTQVAWAPGHYNILRICHSCGGIAGSITEEETAAFLETRKEPKRRLTPFELESLIQIKRKPQ